MLGHLFASPLVRTDLGSGPQPVDLLDVDTETKLLVECLETANKVIRWKTESANSNSFRQMLSLGCTALHFTGHGLPGQVTFENKKGEMHLITEDELKKLFVAGNDSGEPTTKLVFVSACHSESVGKAFIEAGVPHVVAVSKTEEILDLASQEFARSFYTALFAGKTVREAFEIGQAAVRCNGDIPAVHRNEAAKFLLLGPGTHDEPVFADCAEGAYANETRSLPQNDCDAVAEFFVGRAVEVQQVFAAFVEGSRLVNVIGEKGIGKTQVVLRMCEFCSRRYLFRHVFFLNLQHAVAHHTHGHDCYNPEGGEDVETEQEHQQLRMLSLFRRAFGLDVGDHDEEEDRIDNSTGVSMGGEGSQIAETGTNVGAAGAAGAAGIAEAVGEVGAVGAAGAAGIVEIAGIAEAVGQVGAVGAAGAAAAPAPHSPRRRRRRRRSEAGHLDQMLLLEQVRRKCAEGRCLLVLDGCEAHLSNRNSNIGTGTTSSGALPLAPFLSQLLKRVPTLSLLLTTLAQVGSFEHVAERVVRLEAMRSVEAAMLFVRRAPRKLNMAELWGTRNSPSMRRSMGMGGNPYIALAESPVLIKLRGHPGDICALVSHLQDCDLSSEADQKTLIQRIEMRRKAAAAAATTATTAATGAATHPPFGMAPHLQQRLALGRALSAGHAGLYSGRSDPNGRGQGQGQGRGHGHGGFGVGLGPDGQSRGRAHTMTMAEQDRTSMSMAGLGPPPPPMSSPMLARHHSTGGMGMHMGMHMGMGVGMGMGMGMGVGMGMGMGMGLGGQGQLFQQQPHPQMNLHPQQQQQFLDGSQPSNRRSSMGSVPNRQQYQMQQQQQLSSPRFVFSSSSSTSPETRDKVWQEAARQDSAAGGTSARWSGV